MPRGSGRRPKPTKLKQLAGNPGKRTLNESEPAPSSEPPEMPRGLSRIAQAEWKSIVPQLSVLGLLTRIDGKALAAYCHAYSRWCQAEKEIDRLGLLLKEAVFGTYNEDDDEAPIIGVKYKRNPAVTISNDALKLMKSFLIEFGLTPASRSRLRVDKPGEEADPFEKFLRGGKPADGKHVN